MGNKKENIDQLFNEKFQNFEAETPYDAWQGVSNKLDRIERKKRIIILRWSSIAAALVLAFFSGWYFDKSTSSVHDQPSISIPSFQEVTNETINKQNKVNSNPSTDTSKASETDNHEVMQNSGQINSSSGIVSQPLQETPTVIKSTREQQKQKPLISLSEPNESSPIIQQKDTTPLSFSNVLPKTKPNLVLNERFTNDLVLNGVSSADIKDQQNPYATIDPNQFPGRKVRDSKFELGILGGPTIPFRNVRYDKQDNAVSNNVENERLENSYAAGLQFTYKRESRFEYTAGLMVNNWSQSSNNIILEGDDPSNAVSGTTDEFVGNTSYGSVKFDVTSSLNQVSPSTEAGQFILLPNIQQQYQFVEIPLGVAYYLVDGKFQVKAQMGLNTRILSSSSVKLEYPNGEVEDYDGLNPNAFSLQLSAGPNFGYSLTNRLKLQVSPMIFYGLTPNTDMDGVETYHHQFLLFSGFSFRL